MAGQTVEIDGEVYAKVESLGFVHSIGAYAVRVLGLDGQERTAVKRRGEQQWRLWTTEDRIGR